MREIKFRAWNKEEKIFYDFRQLVITLDGNICEKPRHSPIKDHIDLKNRYILQQFTCLKDKNGKEIYEGDIVCVSGNINCFKERGEVIFEYGCFFFSGKRFTPKHLTMYPRDLLCECQTTFYTKNTPPEKPLTKFLEVIGNIYENPELLTH